MRAVPQVENYLKVMTRSSSRSQTFRLDVGAASLEASPGWRRHNAYNLEARSTRARNVPS